MPTRNKIICALFMCAFVIYSCNVCGYNWNQYVPSRETVLRYLNPYEYSWKTYAKVLAASMGIAALWQLYKKQQQVEQMKKDSLEKVSSIRQIIKDTYNGANFFGELGIIENAIRAAADEGRMVRLQWELEKVEKEYKEQLVDRIKQKGIPEDGAWSIDDSLEKLGQIYQERK